MSMSRPPLPMAPTRLFGRLMEATNEGAYRRALASLSPPPKAAILEIGFGPGKLVEMALQRWPDAKVAGVDPTADMVDMARARPAVRQAGLRADLRLGGAECLPWPNGSFDIALAVHSFQFWNPVENAARELRRVMRPGGIVRLVLRDHSAHAPD